MPKCSVCGQSVESYGWNKQGRVVCVSCENWANRIEMLKNDREKKLMARKGLKVGDVVVVDGKKGVIISIDKKNTLNFGELEHYLVQLEDGYCSWYYPEQVNETGEKVEVCDGYTKDYIKEYIANSEYFYDIRWWENGFTKEEFLKKMEKIDENLVVNDGHGSLLLSIWKKANWDLNEIWEVIEKNKEKNLKWLLKSEKKDLFFIQNVAEYFIEGDEKEFKIWVNHAKESVKIYNKYCELLKVEPKKVFFIEEFEKSFNLPRFERIQKAREIVENQLKVFDENVKLYGIFYGCEYVKGGGLAIGEDSKFYKLLKEKEQMKKRIVEQFLEFKKRVMLSV